MKNSNHERDTGFTLNGKKVTGIASDTLDKEVAHNFASDNGRDLTCKNCGDTYERGAWDFHSLCNTCFAIFDRQKMIGRINYLQHKGKATDYFESSDEWIKAREAEA